MSRATFNALEKRVIDMGNGTIYEFFKMFFVKKQ